MAHLHVEGEELDVDVAGALVDGGRLPADAPRPVDRRLRRQRHLVVPVSTAGVRLKGAQFVQSSTYLLLFMKCISRVLDDADYWQTYGISTSPMQ